MWVLPMLLVLFNPMNLLVADRVYTWLNHLTVVLGGLWLLQLLTQLGVELSTVMVIWLAAYSILVAGVSVLDLLMGGSVSSAISYGFFQFLIAAIYMILLTITAGMINLILAVTGHGVSFFELWIGLSAIALIAIQLLLKRYFGQLTNPRQHRNGGYSTEM